MPDAMPERIEATNARFAAARNVDGCNVDREVWQAVYASWLANHSELPNSCADREPAE